VTNPLFEAIERITNPYAMQERVYRNRVDAQDANLDVSVYDLELAEQGYPVSATNDHGMPWQKP
jgi:hypothetical protein